MTFVDTDVAAVVLAAGEGRRLRPLTLVRPKPLCPVAGRPLLDIALERVASLPAVEVAVNVHHGAQAVVDHLQRRLVGLAADDGSVAGALAPRRGRRRPAASSTADEPGVVVSWEEPEALGTAGALARLRPWLAGRAALVVNGDTWTDADLGLLLDGWDGEAPRVLTVGEPPSTTGAGGGRGPEGTAFGPRARVAGALVPWDVVAALPTAPSGLWEACWRQAHEDGRLDVVTAGGRFVDCGTPADYLRANLEALPEALRATPTSAVERTGVTDALVGAGAVVAGTATRSVIGAGALVEGDVEDVVVWPGAHVAPGERLRGAIRYESTTGVGTVLVR